MSDNVYQVVKECAYATVDTASGRAKVLLYKGALVPADAPELKHLLDNGFVQQVGGDETGGVNADGLTAAEVAADAEKAKDAEERKAASDDAAELEARREAARAKLPPDGSMPHPNAGQAVWVEYHVAKGGSYEDLAGQDKADLIELAKSRQS